ncbi:hypothetical protein U8P80_30595 (plasmid) [Rhizobium beringeri]|nr:MULTISPECIES: hypothetical protein [Rhizobium]UIJ82908.1 hypothetical protein LZK78_26900 [Rhizobium leguminosarum]WSG77759.1 hypothetical protein U8P80_30595 [Rhizobium beringeri]WSH17954.1 hypothetical protein U8P74_30595 [Rhizobium beringeri]WSH54283.1 hypothetical protein U8Q06_27130 [Rhizobium beringeri]
MTAAGSITIRHVMSKTPKNQWYVVEAAKGIAFLLLEEICTCGMFA